MESVIVRAFVIRTSENRFVGKFNDNVPLVSANIYACHSAAMRDKIPNACERIQTVLIELEETRGC